MTDASDLRILSLSLGGALATNDASATDTARRQVEYGSHFAEYVIIARTPNRPDVYQPRNLCNTVRVIPTLSKGNLSALLRMILIGSGVLRQSRFDAITAQEPFLTGFAGYWLKRWFTLPLQVQLHGDFLDNSYWLKERSFNHLLNSLGKWVLSRADTVRTVNQIGKQWVTQEFGFPAERVICTPVRVDLASFGRACGDRIHTDYARRGFRKLVLFVGKLAKHKGVTTLIQMFAQVIEAGYRDSSSRVCLVLVGDGEERSALDRMALDLGIAHLVDFAGVLPLQNVAEYMAAADVVVLPSHREGLPRVLVEAGAVGRPCVATVCPGPCDILRDGETGYLVPIGDATTMGTRVLYLLQNPEIAETMGAQARERVLAMYDPHRLVTKNVESLRRTAELGLRKESR